jgi:hypothetical protein
MRLFTVDIDPETGLLPYEILFVTFVLFVTS